MNPVAMNDAIADACSGLFEVYHVEINSAVNYLPLGRDKPAAGHVILTATVGALPRDGEQLPDEAVPPFETDHPTLPGQRVKWQHSDTTQHGMWKLTFVGLHPK